MKRYSVLEPAEAMQLSCPTGVPGVVIAATV